MDPKVAERALVKWINGFDFCPDDLHSLSQLIDGVLVSKILNHVDAKNFATVTASAPSGASESSNWVLVHAKMKKLFKSISQYYESHFHQSIDLLEPNLSAIARDGDLEALVTLVTLILTLAVQSEKRQFYIEMIQKMDQENQHSIMLIIETTLKSLQQEQTGDRKASPSRKAPVSPIRDTSGRMLPEIEKLQKERNDLEQSLKTSNKSLEAIKLQNDSLSRDFNSIQARLQETEAKLKSLERLETSETVLKAEINTLKSRLENSDLYKHELENTISSQNGVINDLNKKLEEATIKMAESSTMKDKLDELSHVNEKLMRADQTIERLKKKIDEGGDSKKQVKELEVENESLMKKYSMLEQEYQKMSSFKPLIETYKTQLMGIEHKNSQLATDKINLEHELESANLKILTLEEQNAMEQKTVEMLREQITGLEFQHPQNTLGSHFAAENSLDHSISSHEDSSKNLVLEQQITSLQKENQMLRSQSSTHESHQRVLVLENLLQDANNLKAKYEKDYLDAHKKLIFLENEVNALREGQSAVEAETVLRLRTSINDYESEVAQLKKKIVEISSDLERTKNELTVAQSELNLIGKDQRRQITEAKAESESEIQNIRIENSKINDLVKTLESDKQKYMDQLHGLLVEKDSLKDEALHAERLISQLKEQLSAIEKNQMGSESNLKSDLQQREEQIMQLQRALKKAKDYILQQEKVIKERKSDNPDQPNHYNEAVLSLQNYVQEKETELDRLRRDYESQIHAFKQEQKLMASAWYDLGMQLQKKHILPNQVPESPSWLRRQRQGVLDSPIRRR